MSTCAGPKGQPTKRTGSIPADLRSVPNPFEENCEELF